MSDPFPFLHTFGEKVRKKARETNINRATNKVGGTVENEMSCKGHRVKRKRDRLEEESAHCNGYERVIVESWRNEKEKFRGRE